MKRISLLSESFINRKQVEAVQEQLANVKNDPNLTFSCGCGIELPPPIQNSSQGESSDSGCSVAEKVFANSPSCKPEIAMDVCVEKEAPTPTLSRERRNTGAGHRLEKITPPQGFARKTRVATLSNEDTDEDEEDDNCEVLPMEAPLGHSLRFTYSPSDYIEYSIAIKSATDLCSTFDYFNAHSDVYNLQVGYTTQQVCCLNGTAVTKLGSSIVTVNLRFNPENSHFAITIHSYEKDAAREIGRQFRRLCRKGNFYKGQHLQANSFEKEPLSFLANPQEQKIYGFEKEYDSIRTNTVRFFGMHNLHKLCPQRGVLLSGIPGSGKSLIVSQIKRECLAEAVTVVDMSMAAMHHVGTWYDKIEKWLTPCLVVMEDLDIIGVSRDMEKSVQPITTDLLNSLSGNRKTCGVIVTLATTNRPEVLDNALVRARRMDQRYVINGLNPIFKKQLLTSYLEPYKVSLSPELSDKAVDDLGEDTTGADISSIAVSTLIHVGQGEPSDKAFAISLNEWKESHKKKSSTTGF